MDQDRSREVAAICATIVAWWNFGLPRLWPETDAALVTSRGGKDTPPTTAQRQMVLVTAGWRRAQVMRREYSELIARQTSGATKEVAADAGPNAAPVSS